MERPGVPIIGGAQNIKGVVSAFGALPLKMDENCMFEPEQVVSGPNGQPLAIAGRRNLVDATDLVEMIRVAVREELDARDERARRSD